MNNWQFKSADFMKVTQDVVTNSPTASLIDTYISQAKALGATHISVCVPYDHPTIDTNAQTKVWVDAARKYGLNVWFRKSWCSDEGWYGVAKNNSNDRINDTKNWVAANASLFADGDIFTPKPEPQNMGVIGMNSGSNARFQSVAAFNSWLRSMMSTIASEFTTLNKKVTVGMWGFDGFVVCGYGNPDWQGKSFLEAATVQACGNVLAVDHYPELVGKPMTDFQAVFKQVWPGVKYVQGEWGSVGTGDIATQINTTMGTLDSDPNVVGFNYWTMVDGSQSEALLNPDGSKKEPAFDLVSKFFTPAQSVPPVSTPTPTPPQTGVTIDPTEESTTTETWDFHNVISNGEVIGKIKVYH
jgi:hypothetical protein